MITPVFSCSQNDEFVVVTIRVPYVKVDAMEMWLGEHEFKFFCKPYFLSLTFEEEIVEDGREKAAYDVGKGEVTVSLPKKQPGTFFPGLDLQTRLLTPSRRSLASLATRDTRVFIRRPKYGFNDAHSGFFEPLREELSFMVSLPQPDSTAASQRSVLRMKAEDEKFDWEYYVADTMQEDEAIVPVLEYTPWWTELKAAATAKEVLGRKAQGNASLASKTQGDASLASKASVERERPAREAAASSIDAGGAAVVAAKGGSGTMAVVAEIASLSVGGREGPDDVAGDSTAGAGAVVIDKGRDADAHVDPSGGGGSTGAGERSAGAGGVSIAGRGSADGSAEDAASGKGARYEAPGGGTEGTAAATGSTEMAAAAVSRGLADDSLRNPDHPDNPLSSIDDPQLEIDPSPRRDGPHPSIPRDPSSSSHHITSPDEEKPSSRHISFTEEEKEAMRRLPRKEFLIDDAQACLLGIPSILFGYCYDVRTTMGDANVESEWTISTLSPTLSWLETFHDPHALAIACARRALAYPLYRHWGLTRKVLEDVVDVLTLGRRAILRAMLAIRRTLEYSDARYLLNRLYLDDYCVWLQAVKKTALRRVAADMAAAVASLTVADIGRHQFTGSTWCAVGCGLTPPIAV
eukprot:jgi/Mesvir1/27394/Mv07197-RA.1